MKPVFYCKIVASIDLWCFLQFSVNVCCVFEYKRFMSLFAVVFRVICLCSYRDIGLRAVVENHGERFLDS